MQAISLRGGECKSIISFRIIAISPTARSYSKSHTTVEMAAILSSRASVTVFANFGLQSHVTPFLKLPCDIFSEVCAI